ncbi:MAG: MBL fold metallo-hydrolase [Rhodoferax sp.]
MQKIVIIMFSLLSLWGCSRSPTRTVTDHFDGAHFFNPTYPKSFAPSVSDAFRLIIDKRSVWPDKVENTATPLLNEELQSNEVAVTYVNHATFLIQLAGLNILTDPVWADHAGPFGRIGPSRVRVPGVALDDLPNIDVILISHNHYDHLDMGTLKRLAQKFTSTVLVPIGDKELVESAGFRDVREMDWWEDTVISQELNVAFTPTQHFSRRGLFDLQRSLWGSYLIKGAGQKIYFGGDAGYSIHFSEIKKRLGTPDIALLGIGGYEPRWFMQPIHMNPAEAVQAHFDLGARQSIAMHFGTFQLSSEPIDQPVSDLVNELTKQRGLKDKFVVLKEGETRVFPSVGEDGKMALQSHL